MNIFLHEMKMHRNSIIIWSIAFSLTVIFFMSMFPTMSENVSIFEKMMENFPPGFADAFGFDLMIFGTALGFYSFIFLYTTLLGGIQAMKYGLSILSIEEREKTADFLISKPVSRNKIIISKVVSVITSIVITDIVFITVSYIVIRKYVQANFDYKLFIMIASSLFFIQIIFMTIGLLISVIPRKIKAVTPITMGVVFGLFVISLFSSAFDDKKLEYITPFKYFEASEIFKNQSYNMTYVIISAVLIAASLGVTYYRYMKKDMAQI